MRKNSRKKQRLQKTELSNRVRKSLTPLISKVTPGWFRCLNWVLNRAPVYLGGQDVCFCPGSYRSLAEQIACACLGPWRCFQSFRAQVGTRRLETGEPSQRYRLRTGPVNGGLVALAQN